MDLFKIKRGPITRFYESKKSFQLNWPKQAGYYRFYDIIAYKIDWKNKCWKEIKRVGPDG